MPRRAQAPIVGRKQMAAILGVHRNNSFPNRLPDLPPSLQEQFGPDVIDVTTPLWYREDIERYATQRARREAESATA